MGKKTGLKNYVVYSCSPSGEITEFKVIDQLSPDSVVIEIDEEMMALMTLGRDVFRSPRNAHMAEIKRAKQERKHQELLLEALNKNIEKLELI